MRIHFQWRRPGDWSFNPDPTPIANAGWLARWLRWLGLRKAGPLPGDGLALEVLLRVLALLHRLQDPAEPLLRRLAMLRTGEPLEFVGEAAEWTGPLRTGRLLQTLLRRSLVRHWRGVALNLIALPLTLFLSVLPGPNLFLFWSAYRLPCHVLALRGARRGLRALADPPAPSPRPPGVDLRAYAAP